MLRTLPQTGVAQREIFFSEGEYERRLAAVRSEMVSRGIRILVTMHPGNICYLAGYFSVNIWDLMFLVVPEDRQPLVIAWQFERGRFLSSGVNSELVSWESGTDPIDFLSATMKKRELDKSCHIDTGSPYTPYSVVQKVIAALDGRPVTDVIERIRLVKSREEIVWLEKAGAITDRAIEAATEKISPGKRDYDIAAAACSSLIEGGSEFFCIDPIVCVGWRSGTPHSNRGGSVVGENDPVFLEMGATLARYTCPIMRTRVAGQPTPEISELAEHSSNCLEAMIDVMRAGVRACDVVAVGRKVLEPILDQIVFHHVYGYSLGIGFPPTWIENPYFLLVAENEAPLRSGMVFHLPLMLRLLGRFGAGFSEAVEITQDGHRIFSRTKRRLAP